MKTVIVIAAYNEEKVIGSVIKDLRKEGYKNIVVVNDGSKDNTGDVAKKSGVIVLEHIINRGQGAALKTGTNYALRLGAEIIVHFDADGQMRAKDIKKIITPISNRKVDVTLGSRFLGKAENIDVAKKVVLKLARLVVFVLYGLWLTDSQIGFRALSKKAAEKIEITSDKMEHAGEILGEIKKKKLKYKEIPVTIKYTDYSKAKGQSWTKSFELGLRMIIRNILKR